MKYKNAILTRLFLVAGMLLLVPMAIGVQIVRLNWVAGEGLRALWQDQAIEYQEIPAKRGGIFDRNGRILATNTVYYKLALDPQAPQYKDSVAEDVASILSTSGYKTTTSYLKRIAEATEKGNRYIVLERQLPYSVYADLRALNNKSIILERNFSRVYGFNQLAAHVLGYVNYNSKGIIGIEAAFDDQLKGVNGIRQVRKDRHEKVFEYVGAPIQNPIDGSDVYTTLDVDIQSIAETELVKGVEANLAKSGVAIVMEVETGAIRAMTSWPSFNPNKPATMSKENRRNYAISDMIEPGSTFKLVTAIAAIDQNVLEEGEIFDTPENGRKLIHGLAMVDHDPLGSLNFRQVIAKSSNIATSEIAMRISKSAFYQYARNLGFGTPTDIELPGESSGLLKKPMVWTNVTQPFMSIGYEVLATPLQITQAYAAFANDGVLMKPYIVERVVGSSGKIDIEHQPIKVRKAIDKDIIAELKPILEEVVSDSGTAVSAAVQGMQVAGKTGTAKMVKNGQYTLAYRASFAGYFPSDNPKYVCFVLLEEPKRSIYGGYTAGPIFKNIAQRIAAQQGHDNGWLVNNIESLKTGSILPTPHFKGYNKKELALFEDEYDFDLEIEGNQDGYLISAVNQNADSIDINDEVQIQLESNKVNDELITVPDVRGMSMRLASRILHDAKLNVQLERSGTVYQQFPLAGELMKMGKTVVLRGKARSLAQLSDLGDLP